MNDGLRRNGWVGCLAIFALAIGCDSPGPPAFRLNMVQMASSDTPTAPEHQQAIADVLGALFGTPDEPYALPETGLDLAKLRMAAGPAWTNEKGANFGLYRRHCVHCHGVTGDGRGPTARFLNPYPRDYRAGIYKFKSTYNPVRPTDEDLHKVLINGVPGTAMPSFSLLPASEVEALLEYVKYLSMRGELETALIHYVYDDLEEEVVVDENGNPKLDEEGEEVTRLAAFDPSENSDHREAVAEFLQDVVDKWNEAAESVIVPSEEFLPADDRTPEEVAASVENGRKLFYGARANCVKCHGPTALGDGQQDDQNFWNKTHKKFLGDLARGRAVEKPTEEDRSLMADQQEVADSLYSVRNAIPRNLRQGIYRGGHRRIDVFWRAYAGIGGTPMPGVGPASAGAKGTLTEAEIWNLVDYVLALPYETPSQPQRALPVNVDEVL